MSIMDMFRSVTGTVTAPAAANTAGQKTGPEAAAGNTTVPSSSTPRSDGSLAAIPAAGEGDKSPLAEFDKLWSTPDPKTAPASPSNLAINFTSDPAKLMEAARKIDFSKVISPELAVRLQKGGDNNALVEAMNAVSQATYAQSVGATGAIVQEALSRQAKVFETKVMPEILRNHDARRTLQADNELFQNPAVAPLVDAVERQLAQHNPKMSAAEISAKAKGYLSGFATEFVTGSGKVISDKPADASKNGRGETNWADYFGVDSSNAA